MHYCFWVFCWHLAFFAGIEIAFVSANKLAVELKKKQGRRSAIILSALLDKPYTFVGVCITAYTFFYCGVWPYCYQPYSTFLEPHRH